MAHHLYTLLCLLIESLAARRDAQIRFLKEENRVLRSRIHTQRLILSPEERRRLLVIGRELSHGRACGTSLPTGRWDGSGAGQNSAGCSNTSTDERHRYG